MAIKPLKGIEIYPSIHGLGEIYAFDLSFGDDGATLNLNVINETGVYPIEKLKAGYLAPYKITLHGEIVFYMYLTKYVESISANRKALSLEFVDGSHILDRVQVVLMDINISTTDSLGNVKANAVEYMTTHSKKVVCESCDLKYTKYIATQTKIKKLKSSVGYPLFDDRVKGRYYVKLIPAIQGENVIGDNRNGGFILVGTEKYNEDACSVPEIIYNLTDLKIAAKRIGITIDIPDFFPGFTISTPGTLRECLASFCQSFAFSLEYNIFKREPTIGFIDLKKPVILEKIRQIKEEAKNFKSTDINEPIVSDIQDSQDLKATSKKFISISARVGLGTEEKTVKDLNYEASYQAVKLGHYFKLGGEAMGGRTDSQVMISSYLAKASPIYRVLYNLSLRGEITDEHALYVCGFIVGMRCTPQDNLNLLGKGYAFDDEKIKKALVDIGAKDPKTGAEDFSAFDLYIGDYNKEVEGEWAAWELAVHDFLGKYYFNYLKATSDDSSVLKLNCHDPYYHVDIKGELDPPGVMMFKRRKDDACNTAFPFKDILSPPGAEERLEKDYFDGEFMRIFTRSDQSYSISPAFVGNLLNTRYESIESIDYKCEKLIKPEVDPLHPHPLENFKPHWLPIEAHVIASLSHAIKGTPLASRLFKDTNLTLADILRKKERGETGFKNINLHFAMVPSNKTIKKVLQISELYKSHNPREIEIEKRLHVDFANKNCPKDPCQAQKESNSLIASPENPCACSDESVINAGSRNGGVLIEWGSSGTNLQVGSIFYKVGHGFETRNSVRFSSVIPSLSPYQAEHYLGLHGNNRFFRSGVVIEVTKDTVLFVRKIDANRFLLYGSASQAAADITLSIPPNIGKLVFQTNVGNTDSYTLSGGRRTWTWDTVCCPSEKPHTTGPEPAESSEPRHSAFSITLQAIHGSNNGVTIEVAFPFGSRPSMLDPSIAPVTTTFNPLSLMNPVGKRRSNEERSKLLIVDDERWLANFHEKITKKEFHFGLSRAINDFAVPGNVSKIKMSHEEVGSHVVKDLTGSRDEPNSIVLNLSDYNSGGFMSLQDYFEQIKIMSNIGSIHPRKTLKITLLGADLGSFKSFMSFGSGFKSIQISPSDNQGAKMTLTFESRPQDETNFFSTLFKQQMAVEDSQKRR